MGRYFEIACPVQRPRGLTEAAGYLCCCDVHIIRKFDRLQRGMGAGGAVEAVATIKTVITGIIPPTINLHTPDPECDLDYVPNQARSPDRGVAAAASNSMGFGGHNVALIFRRP